MAECNWKPELHGGKPCPKHGNAGQGSNHQVRISGGKYQTRIGGDDGDWEDISKEEFDELKDGGYEEFDATVDDDFGFDEEETEEDEDLERGLRAAEEIEAAKPKEPQLRGRWKDEVITDKNRESFLNENGISDRFYWDGADLVDKKSGAEVYSLPRGGAQASYVWDTVFGGEKNVTEEKPEEAEDPKKILSHMEEIRNEEREKERELLTKFADKAITYDEFKDAEKKLYQEAQTRVDSLYEKLSSRIKSSKGQRRRTKDGGFEIRRSPDDEWQQVTEEEYNEVAYEDYKEPFKKKNTSGGK